MPSVRYHRTLATLKRTVLLSCCLFQALQAFAYLGCMNRMIRYKTQVPIVMFNADSAYHFIQQQVELGSRVPNSPAHYACKNYLKEEFNKLGVNLVVQKFKSRAFNGEILQLYNIIASFNPTATKRLLLAAHWDTRPFADKDRVNPKKPIEGANDGASGVGILLEIARTISQQPLQWAGIDIILFDGEDYGPPEGYPQTGPQQSFFWCLGSQFWCQYPHQPNYHAEYGILLDMVGGQGATFYKEGWSLQYASAQATLIWRKATALGHSAYFINRPSECYILDDHYFVNKYRGIPMIDIIDHHAQPESCFKGYHHTHADNITGIDKQTIQAVGETVLHVIYDFDASINTGH